MSRTSRTDRAPHQLWLSRPPYLLLARVTNVAQVGSGHEVEYDLLDIDGSTLVGAVREPLDSNWWADFQPLVRREG